MEFKKFMNLGIKTEEGVLITKFLMSIHLANEANVLKIKNSLENHTYTIGVVPGEFLKIFSMNPKEIDEFEKILVEIDELGLKDIFSANLKTASFKRSFLEKLKFCINNHLPYLNPDNTFISDLYDNEKFGEYSAKVPIGQIKTIQEINESSPISQNDANMENKMDMEDKQVYNEIIEKLNYLLLAHPTDEMLAKVVNNVTNKIVSSILRKEYKFLSLNDVVKSIMFEGLDVTPVDNIRIEELIDSIFPITEERSLAQ